MRKDAAPAQGIESCAREIPGRLRVLLGNLPSDVNLWGARVVIDVKALYGDVARLEDLPLYIEQTKTLAGQGIDVVLTGQGPTWLYLAIAHALHSVARRLYYERNLHF